MDRAAGFPGTLYDAVGRSLDPTIPDLLQEQIDACPHRSMVTDRDVAPVARVWLLADDATPDPKEATNATDRCAVRHYA